MTLTSLMPQRSVSTAKNRYARLLDTYLPDLPEALCRDQDPEKWFGPHVCDQDCDGPDGCMAGKSEQGRFARIKAAKAVCEECPVREQCLDWAVETNQEFGVWGGKTERERAVIRRERNRP